MPDTLFAVSSEFRTKLMAANSAADIFHVEDKENAVPTYSMQKRNIADDEPFDDEALTSLSQRERTNCPQTPSERIPFSDLIANPEDIVGKIFSATPLDRIEWRSGPGSSEPPCSAKSVQRGKKRARSSSPTSLSQPQISRHFEVDRDPLDLESIGQSLRTPKHEDPLSLLWTNYAGHKVPEENNDPALPPLPPMSSSPGTPSALKKDNLRRTASCGIEWPTSTTKKRKIYNGDPHGRARGIFAARKDSILAKSANNQSRVSILVDSIHQSLLQKAASEENGPSSSSPLPERHLELHNSPTKITPCLKPILEESENTANDKEEIEDATYTNDSSEFGDMDLDLDDPELLTALEQAATQKPPSTEPKVRTDESRDLKRFDSPPGIRNSHSGTEAQAASGSRQKPVEISDEFDNFDDDEDFATELAELVRKVDSQDVSNLDGTCEPSRSDLIPGKTALGVNDDEFNDAFDDDDSNEIWTKLDEQATRPALGRASVGKQVRYT